MTKNCDKYKFRLVPKLDESKKASDFLREEIKRLGELSGGKIIEIENNINTMERMKNFEKDNFKME